MTPRRPTRKAGILILSGSFGGTSRMVGESLQRYLRSREESVDVTLIDLFEETMPSLNVLARFAYQRDATFFPSGCMSWPEYVDAFPSNPVICEVERGGMARLRSLLEGMLPAGVISCFPLGGVLAAHAARDLGSVNATVVGGFSARGAALHRDTDLHFVTTRESRDELVVAGVPYDRIVVSGIPVPTTDTAGPHSGARGFRAVIDGTGPGAQVGKIAGVLAAGGIGVVVTPAGDDRTRRAISELADRGASVREAASSADASRALPESSVVVAHGGSALAVEAVTAGCPVILYNEIPVLELDSVDFLVNTGAALVARDETDATEKAQFLSAHPQRLAQMAACARELAKPMAAQSVCERVFMGM